MPRGGNSYVGTVGTFAEVIRAYLASPRFQGLSPETQRSYRRTLALAELREGLGGVPVDQMRPALCQAFLDAFHDRPAAQHKAKRILAAVERWAIVRDLLPRSITLGTEAPGSDGGHEPWSEFQVMFAENGVASHLSAAVSMGASTGQRGSDLVRMRWTDLETIEGRPGINVTQLKTNLRLWVPFTQELIRTMSTWERRPGYILTKNDGTPFTGQGLRAAWREERARFPELAGLTLHGLRSTAVVRLRRAGVPATQICDVVGMSLQMVERYCRFADQKKNAIAAMETLEAKNTPAKVLKFRE